MVKIMIFSHESDIDGLGNIVLGKLAFKEIDYVLEPNVNKLEETFRKYIEDGKLDEYERIYVTDLTLYKPAIDLVNNSELSKKVLVFDHHASAIKDGYDKYEFATITETDNGKKTCGTELFYKHLISIGLKRTKTIDEFVELTRQEDTWEWKKTGEQGQKAHDLATLFNVIGIDEYINRMYEKLSKETFELNEEEKTIISNKYKRIQNELEKAWSEAAFLNDELGNKFVILYANYELRNELGEYARRLNIDDLKYIIIVALKNGIISQKSYRVIEQGFDVGKIAESHGGNGHPAAAQVEITEEQRNYALNLIKQNKKQESLKYLVEANYEK